MQQQSASTPTSPLHRVRGFEDNEMDVPMLQQQTAAVSAARSVSSYAGSAAQWVWEKGRRRSWFAGSSAQQSSSSSPSSSASSSASQSAFPFVPPLQSLACPAPNRLRLPDSLIELIFHRLVSQRLLTLSTLHLFWCAPLTRIDLAEYEGVTDAWLELLLMGWMVDRRGGGVGGLGLGAGGKRGGKEEERGWGRSGERTDELDTADGAQDEEDDVLAEDESDSEDADGDDAAKEEEEKTQADSSYSAASPTAAMDIEVKADVLSSPSVPLLDDSWSLSSSPAFTPRLTTSSRPLLTASGSSVMTTRSSSLSSTPQQPPALSTSPVIKPITFSSLQSPSVSNPVHAAAAPPLSLRYLDLSKCDLVTDRPLYSLVYAPLLSHLALNGCTQISDSLLCAVLPLLPSLLSLSLNNCVAVSDVSLSALREAHRLQHLQLDCTAITNAGLLSLSHLTRLRTLSVGCNGNRVTDAGLGWLPQCFSLRSLSVCHTGVQDMSLYRSLQRLRQLDISGTKLSSTACGCGHCSAARGEPRHAEHAM